MSSTAARLFLSKSFGNKVVLPDYNSLAKANSRSPLLHLRCRTLVTVPSKKTENDNNAFQNAEKRQFHVSAHPGVVFKPKYHVDVPQTDFFSYIVGDISGHEDTCALVCGLTGRKYTYAKLKDYCTRVGVSMLERGYRKGDVVAVYSPNVPEYIFTILG